MKAVLSAESMRLADEAAIGEFGIPGFTLMETAGRESVRILALRSTPSSDRILCCCGTGNNGGDGLVVARTLNARGYAVDVLLIGDESRETSETKLNRRLLERIADQQLVPGRLRISRISNTDESDSSSLADSVRAYIAQSQVSWIVDGLLGTGTRGAVREPLLSAVDAINSHPAKALSLDIPTGLHADRGNTDGPTVRADVTVCMAAIKPGILLNDGPAFSGDVFVVEIGIPAFILDRATNREHSGRQTEVADVLSRLPHREQNAHKYSSGTLTVVAGSEGFTGAPVLASEAGLRVGSGAVILATRNSVRDAIDRKVVEVMTIGLPEATDGITVDEALLAMAASLQKANAIVIGCGLGPEIKTSNFVRRLLQSWKGSAVVDADALFAISDDPSFVRNHSNGRWVLTPHQGEFERIISASTDWTNRADLASRISDEWNCVLVLKGNPTVIGIPGESTIFNPTGNVLLATAGTGDVLAGMIGGYLAQGLTPADAAIVGTYVGGLAADQYLAELGTSTMIASDVVHRIPRILSDLIHGQVSTPQSYSER